MKSSYLLGLLLLVAVVGCGDSSGPSLYPVKGKLTLYGKPYPKGIVTFTPKEGGPSATSVTDENGDFELWSTGKKGAVMGQHSVSVTTVMEPVKDAGPVAPTSSDDPSYAKQVFGGPASYKAAKEQKDPIPEKYNKSSVLVNEVKSGSNVINLDLK